MLPCDPSPASEEYADFLLRYSARSLYSLYDLAQHGCVNLIDRNFAVVHARLDQIDPISISRYTYGAIPKLYGLLDTTALESSAVLPVFTQPVVHATGRGVLLGFIDTGIDYTNPLFRHADGTSRILGIWDQTVESGQMPPEIEGFQPFYGATYDQEQINEALALDDPYQLVPSRDTDGHGTFMAGVAAGNQIHQPFPYAGAAPEASLAVVKLKPAKQYLRDFFLIRKDAQAYQENDIMAGISYLQGMAIRHQMPLVLCLSIGTAQGSHEGQTPLGQYLDNLNGYTCVAAAAGAGNEVGLHHHFLGNIAPDQEYEDVELRVGSDETGFCAELWARQPELYTVGLVTPTGEIISRIPLATGNETVIPLSLDSGRITVDYQNNEGGSGNQLIFLRFEDPSPGIWHIRVYPSVRLTGTYHIWLPMEGFLSDQTIFLRANPDTTVTDPGNAALPLTVGAYNHSNNSIYIHSSRGYTAAGRIKPDLAAPGVEVQGPALPAGGPTGLLGAGQMSFPTASQAASSTLNRAALLGESSSGSLRFTRRTGTSVAAAVAAGALADLFTWAVIDGNDSDLSGISASSMLIRGANRSPAFTYPNTAWGYGTLDLYQAFLRVRE